MAKPKRRDNKPLNSQNHVKVELESVLRLRPLQKKEKGDQIVLEPKQMEDGKPMTAVIHPTLAKQKHPESPAMKMLSPETLQLCKDTEYHLNQILPDECDQEKVYYSLGLPLAKESMDFLKFKKGAKGLRRTSSLIVCMGVENSGKTHTCFGAGHGNISKRRSPQDGLVPRILDSLFSQSKHHVKNRRTLSFGVRMSLVQVAQEKVGTPKHDDDSVVQDLLLLSLAKAAASPMRSASPARKLPSVNKLIATFERTRATVGIPSSSKNEALVRVHQDIDSTDFVTDAVVKTCRDVTEARQLLASGLQAGEKLSSRHLKAHVMVILQPVLMAPDGSIEREGGKIGIVDMAGIEQSSQKKRNTAARRHKDSFGASSSQSDSALNAVLHCVRSLQHNSMILSGKTPALDIVDGAYDGITIDDAASEISCVSQEKAGKAKGPTFKVVPYRQHNLTMLLQPFFSARQTNTTKLTLLVAAYPGHRDHAEKKSLLNDLELLFEVAREPEVGAALTGFEKRPLSPIQFSPSSASGDDESHDGRREDLPKPSKKFDKILSSEKPFPSAPSLDEHENLVPLPPPFAPTAPPSAAALPTVRIKHPEPNAPIVCDFPGVAIPSANENPYTSQRAVMAHPQDAERSFEQKRPSPAHNGHSNAHYEEPLKATTSHNIERLEITTKPKSSTPTKAFFSSTKNAINHVVQASTTTGIKMMDKMWTTPEPTEVYHSENLAPQQMPASLEDISRPIPNRHCEELGTAAKLPMGTVTHRTHHSAMKSKSRKRGGDGNNEVTPKRLKKMEKDNRELLNRNQELEQRCAMLSAENRELKRTLEAHTKKEWNKEDEEEWQKQRRQFAAPPLIQSPLSKHLADTDKVFNTTGRYNFAVGQPQFSLQNRLSQLKFQTASELDRRDEAEQEESSEKLQASTTKDDRPQCGSGEKKQDPQSTTSMLHVFHKRLESVKRRRSSLIDAVKEG